MVGHTPAAHYPCVPKFLWVVCNAGVVRSKTGFFVFQFKIEKTMKEKEELLKITASLEKETAQLRDQVERLEKELNYEKEKFDQLELQQKVSSIANENRLCSGF